MSAPTEVTQVCITLRQAPELIDDGVLRIQLTPGVCLYVDADSAPALRALSDAADTAAELLEQAAIVALNTPALPVVPDNVHTMCVPDYGTGAA